MQPDDTKPTSRTADSHVTPRFDAVPIVPRPDAAAEQYKDYCLKAAALKRRLDADRAGTRAVVLPHPGAELYDEFSPATITLPPAVPIGPPECTCDTASWVWAVLLLLALVGAEFLWICYVCLYGFRGLLEY